MTMAAPLLLTSGPAKNEAGLQSNFFVFLCMCVKGCIMGMVWIEPDKHESMLHVKRQARYVEGVYAG